MGRYLIRMCQNYNIRRTRKIKLIIYIWDFYENNLLNLKKNEGVPKHFITIVEVRLVGNRICHLATKRSIPRHATIHIYRLPSNLYDGSSSRLCGLSVSHAWATLGPNPMVGLLKKDNKRPPFYDMIE